jgi:CBS-domain-containing membrane protein
MIICKGAAAILEFNALSSPLAQPRNAILGHIISAIIGVSFAQLLTRSTSNAYLLAPLACALASAAMTLTGTLHPPGGATAVLAVVDPSLRGLRWQLIPLVAISSTVMIAVACLMGNVLRRYPHCWWTTGECGTRWQGQSNAIGLELNDTANKPLPDKNDCSSLATPNCTGSYSRLHEAPILVTCQGVLYPLDLDVGEEESAVLEGLAAKLEARKRYNSNLC